MNAAELVNKWRHVLYATEMIWSWTEPASLAYWAEMASTRNKIIEIGTHLGKSAKVMLLANPNCRLWCIDGWHEPGTEHTARHFLKAEIDEGRCEGYRINFPHNAVCPWNAKAPFDMVVIDNGHEYEEVKNQIELFRPLIRSGGLICGHDLDPGNGVHKAVTELIPDYTEPVPRVWAKVMT